MFLKKKIKRKLIFNDFDEGTRKVLVEENYYLNRDKKKQNYLINLIRIWNRNLIRIWKLQTKKVVCKKKKKKKN